MVEQRLRETSLPRAVGLLPRAASSEHLPALEQRCGPDGSIASTALAPRRKRRQMLVRGTALP